MWEVSAEGTGLHPVLPGWNVSPIECCGSWTADGKYYLFNSSRSGKVNIWLLRDENTLFHRHAEPVPLTFGPNEFTSIVPSKERDKAFVIGTHPENEMVRYDFKTHSFQPFATASQALEVGFSNGGARIAYVGPELQLWSTTKAATNRVQLTSSPLEVRTLSFAPDGTEIAFAAHARGQPWKIYVVSAGGGTPRELVGQAGAWNPQWSPDGRQVIFTASTDSSVQSSPDTALYVLSLGLNRTQKVLGSEGLSIASWSPDGRYIAATDSSQHKLVLLDVQSHYRVVLTRGKLLSRPVWASNGQSIYYQDLLEPGEPVFRLHVRSRERERALSCEVLLASTVQRCAFSGLAPDGAPLMLLSRGYADVYAIHFKLR